MSMLTDQQIQELYNFCEKHLVRYYDVQLELVDHLANAVEEKMEADKQLTFETALDSVYKGFGVMGFGGIVSAKERSINKQWTKLRWQYFKAFFTWPKAAGTLLISCLIVLAHTYVNTDIQKWTLTIIPCVYMIYEIYVAAILYRKRKKRKRQLLLTEMTFFAPIMSFLYFDINFNFFRMGFGTWFDNPDSFTSFAYYRSAFILLILIFLSVSYQSTTEKVLQQAEEEYPLAFV